ncbi:hypothetical protein PHMEG_00021591 [Phytophthora megakarya]|uniref:Uncharacterized protein n=1 Tax=Phytophthora megakarya TaxID=4795 RepID=A0A225VLG1_9STRA|nr:hypothetical protein PHMEG_00021591 [Phytophthora megakarya]
MRSISVLCLASLVEHAQYLSDTLPETHPIFASAIFREEAQMDLLRCKLADDVTSSISPTGIPPYIHLYRQQQETQRAIERMPSVLMGSFSKLLDDKCVGSGVMRKEELQATIRELLTEAGLYHSGDALNQTPPDTPAGSFIYWKRDSKFYRLPESFEFPDVDALGVWRLWWFRNKAMEYPPFKGLQSSDFVTRNYQKRYWEWANLVKHLCDAVESATGTTVTSPQSQHEPNIVFQTAMANVPIEFPHSVQKPRRPDRAAITLRRIRETLHKANPSARTVPFRRRKRRATKQLED